MPSHDSSSNFESLPTETLPPVPEFDDDEYQPIQPKVLVSVDGEEEDDSGEHHEDGEMKLLPGAIRQPCSGYCPGKRNQLPNLMCSKCFCLFHIGCVPDGVWLENPNRFICPVS